MQQSPSWESNSMTASQKIPKLNGTSKFKTMSQRAHTCPCSESEPIQSRPCHSLSPTANFIPSHQCTDLPSCLFASASNQNTLHFSSLTIYSMSHTQFSLFSLCKQYSVLHTWLAQRHTKWLHNSGELSSTVFPKHFCSQFPFEVKEKKNKQGSPYLCSNKYGV